MLVSKSKCTPDNTIFQSFELLPGRGIGQCVEDHNPSTDQDFIRSIGSEASDQTLMLRENQSGKSSLDLLQDIADCKRFLYGKHCQDCNKKMVLRITCKSRFCVSCARTRSARLIEKYAPAIERWHKIFFITFTVRNVPELTREYLDWYNKCFAMLRRRKSFKYVKAGLKAIECTYNEQAGTYHLHSHVVVNRFVDVNALRADWVAITGDDNKQVNIRYVRKGDKKKISKELVKYVTKLKDLPEHAMLTMLSVFSGRRLIDVFGRARLDKALSFLVGRGPTKLDTSDTNSHFDKCFSCGSPNLEPLVGYETWKDIANSASRGDFYERVGGEWVQVWCV